MRFTPTYGVLIANRLDRLRQRPSLWPWAKSALDVLHFIAMVYAQFELDRCWQMASALTFSALLAVVPVTAVTFSLFNSFGTFSQIRTQMQEFLLKQLIPTSDLGQNLNYYLTQFTSNTYQVTFLSVISLFVTSVLLFVTIEYSLGHIWTERKPRSFMRNVTIYTSILVWGPLLLGLSTYLSVTMSAKVHSYVDPVMATTLWAYLFPYATSVLMFFLGFTILPAANVQVRAALLGAGVAAGLWEWAKYGFGEYTRGAVFYSNVYGTLSTVPVFLLWVYTSWIIFLFGAEICRCYQFKRWLHLRGDGMRPSYSVTLLMALASLLVIARRFQAGGQPPDVSDVAKELSLPDDVVGSALDPLVAEGLLVRVNSEGEIYVPARSLDRLSVLEVFRAIHPPASTGGLGDLVAPEFESASSVLKLLQDSQAKTLKDISIAELVEQAEKPARHEAVR